MTVAQHPVADTVDVADLAINEAGEGVAVTGKDGSDDTARILVALDDREGVISGGGDGRADRWCPPGPGRTASVCDGEAGDIVTGAGEPAQGP